MPEENTVNANRMHSELRPWDEVKAIVEPLANKFIPSRQIRAVSEVFEELMEMGLVGSNTNRAARSAFLIGESGSGKSRLLGQLSKEYQPYKTGDTTIFPVLNVEVPATATIKKLNIAINGAMNIFGSAAAEGNDEFQKQAVLKRLARHQVRLVMFDEVQRLYRGNKLMRDVANYLVGFQNSRALSVLYSGRGGLLDLFDTVSELRRRSFGVFYLNALDWAVENERNEYVAFLHEMEESIGLRRKPGLWRKDTAPLLYDFTGGLIGLTADVVILAVQRAARRGMETVTHELLREVINGMKQQRSDVAGRPNPFTPGVAPKMVKAEIQRDAKKINSWKGKRKPSQKYLTRKAHE